MTVIFPKAEVEDAFAEFRRRGIGQLDWIGFTDLFTEDATYVEHNLGTFVGRAAIRTFLVDAMAAMPALTFDIDWWTIEGNRVAFYIWNLLPDPAGQGRTFAFENATVIEYAGDGHWSFEEDFYNPANANRVVGDWIKAGGGPHLAPDRSLRSPGSPLPGGGAHPRDEIEREFHAYVQRGRTAVDTGDWATWADQFTEDARYHEHHYGRFEGRAAIREWITGVMHPFPDMDFPTVWHMIDGNRVVMLCDNRLPDPNGASFPVLVILHYAGRGQWSYEEDIYNPDEAARVVEHWMSSRQ